MTEAKPKVSPATRQGWAVMASKTSPRERGEQKVTEALVWIYRWGWSSPSIIDSLCSTARRGLTRRMVKRGLIVSTRTESGGALKSIPNYILTLTKAGLVEEERNHNEQVKYIIDPLRIDQGKLRHDFLCQKITQDALHAGKIKEFKTEKEMSSASAKDVKQPDILWIFADGMRSAIEMELSGKWERDLDDFVRRLVLSLRSTDETPAKFDTAVITSDAPKIIDRYATQINKIAKYNKWVKNARNYWVVENSYPIPEEIRNRILFKLLEKE
jgi:hypothetical protein